MKTAPSASILLKTLRESLGLKQYEFAEWLSGEMSRPVNPVNISQWEGNKRDVALEVEVWLLRRWIAKKW